MSYDGRKLERWECSPNGMGFSDEVGGASVSACLVPENVGRSWISQSPPAVVDDLRSVCKMGMVVKNRSS